VQVRRDRAVLAVLDARPALLVPQQHADGVVAALVRLEQIGAGNRFAQLHRGHRAVDVGAPVLDGGRQILRQVDRAGVVRLRRSGGDGPRLVAQDTHVAGAERAGQRPCDERGHVRAGAVDVLQPGLELGVLRAALDRLRENLPDIQLHQRFRVVVVARGLLPGRERVLELALEAIEVFAVEEPALAVERVEEHRPGRVVRGVGRVRRLEDAVAIGRGDEDQPRLP
jgi:hypothetical protein